MTRYLSVAKIAGKHTIIPVPKSVKQPPQGEAAITTKLLTFVFLLFMTLSSLLFGQDTIKNFHKNGKVSEIYILKNQVRDGVTKYFDESGTLVSEVPFVSGKVEGVVKHFHPNGMVKESFQIVEGKRTGIFESYDSLGSVIASLNFYNGAIRKETPSSNPDNQGKDPMNEKYNTAAIKLTVEELAFLDSYKAVIPSGDPAVYPIVDEAPMFLRGEEEFYSRLFYPSRALDDELEGTVIIRALVNSDGRIESTEVVKSLGMGCDESAEITVRYTDFIPAKLKGRSVNSYTEVTVNFKLPVK
ncbi:MAG: TonB family protein [Ignavibacteriaceae bacterium]|nr:TonB family protein [Ignavibacteriaceae bacterium]